MARIRTVLIVIAALGAAAMSTQAADAGAPKPITPVIGGVTGATDLQKLIDQFKTKRDTVLADRDALLNQLKNATADQRKQILEKMEAQQKDLIDAQRALGRQIRDEMRKLRQNTPGPGRF